MRMWLPRRSGSTIAGWPEAGSQHAARERESEASMGRHARGRAQSGWRRGQRRDGPWAQRAVTAGLRPRRVRPARTHSAHHLPYQHASPGHCAQSQLVRIGLSACEIDRLAIWQGAGLAGPVCRAMAVRKAGANGGKPSSLTSCRSWHCRCLVRGPPFKGAARRGCLSPTGAVFN